MFIFFKILITAIIIVAVTEIVKFNDRVGALIAALPLSTFIILFWLYYEGNSVEKISNHMSYTIFICTSNAAYVFGFSISYK